MRRACLQAARAVAVAGLLTLPHLVHARQQEPAPTTGHSQATPAVSRLAALTVELAWLADPATFPYPLQARATGTRLEVCGFVPDLATKRVALCLANAHSGLTVLDGIALDPSLPKRVQTHDVAALQSAAIDALKGCRSITDLQVNAESDGRVEVYGAIHSIEEMRTASRTLILALGCTAVDNRLSVIPVNRQGIVMTQVTADGSVCMPGTVHFVTRDVDLPDGVDGRAEETTRLAGWGADRASPHQQTGVAPIATVALIAPIAPIAQERRQPRPVAELPGDLVIPTSAPGSSPTLSSANSAIAVAPEPVATNQAQTQILSGISTKTSDGAASAATAPGEMPMVQSVKSESSPTQAWDMADAGGFASNAPEKAKTLSAQRAEFASSKGQWKASEPSSQTSEASEFAAVAKAPSIRQVVASAPAPGASGRPAETPPAKTAAARNLRSPAVRVSPMTPDGQWPSAFVGSQPNKTTGPHSVPSGPALVSGQPGVTVLQSPNPRAQLPPPALLIQLKNQIETVGGPDVQKVAIRYLDDQTVVMTITIADPSSEKMVADNVLHIEGLAASGVGFEIGSPN